MVQDGLGLAVLLGVGVLLLRPRDFPLLARTAGRLVGLTVRSMRATKDAAESAIKESADLAHPQNPEIIAMRENLKHSWNKFESLTTTVRRDIADVPLNPTVLLRNGWRSWKNTAKDPVDLTNNFNKRKMHENGNTATAVPRGMQRTTDVDLLLKNASQTHVDRGGSPAIKGTGNLSSGADILSRAIEEAALARQERNVFGEAKRINEGPTVDDGNSSEASGAANT